MTLGGGFTNRLRMEQEIEDKINRVDQRLRDYLQGIMEMSVLYDHKCVTYNQTQPIVTIDVPRREVTLHITFTLNNGEYIHHEHELDTRFYHSLKNRIQMFAYALLVNEGINILPTFDKNRCFSLQNS